MCHSASWTVQVQVRYEPEGCLYIKSDKCLVAVQCVYIKQSLCMVYLKAGCNMCAMEHTFVGHCDQNHWCDTQASAQQLTAVRTVDAV